MINPITIVAGGLIATGALGSDRRGPGHHQPIKHVVVIFDENNSFDHYFGTYPRALNPAGEPVFTAAQETPEVNGLTGALLTKNPDSVQPYRLDRTVASTRDNDNHYADEQKAYHGGLLDKFPESTNATPAGCLVTHLQGQVAVQHRRATRGSSAGVHHAD
jgi:phospholipase C